MTGQRSSRGTVALAVGLALLLLPAAAGAQSSRGSSALESGARFTDALNLLERHGYASFSNFREEAGGRFSADVVDNGRTVRVLIDPDRGQVTANGTDSTAPQIQSGSSR